MTSIAEEHVVSLLREAAAQATWPGTPDLRTPVLARIEQASLRPGAAEPRGTGGRPVVRLGRALAFALVGLLLLAGIAAALGYRLPGLDILFVERLPPAGTGLDLGSPIAVDDALALRMPRVLVPASLPRPEAAYSLGTGDRTIITLAYRASAGQSTLAGSDLVLTVMAVPGDADEGLLQKMLGQETIIQPVAVGGSRGWWIAGAPHAILVWQADRTIGELRSALVGDTLLFSRAGTLYRLESASGREATIDIAESMR